MIYRVITPPAAEPVTLEEAKAHLRVVYGDDDVQIQYMIGAARQMLEARIKRALMPQTVEFAVDTFCEEIKLPLVPLLGGLTVRYFDIFGIQQTLAPSAFYLDDYQDPPRLSALYGTPWPATRAGRGAVLIQYQAGYADAESVPAPLKHWILLAIGTMYENRAGVAAGVSLTAMPDEFMRWLYLPYVVYT